MTEAQSKSTRGRRSWPELSLVVRADGKEVTFTDVLGAAGGGLEQDGYRLRVSGAEVVEFSVRRTDGEGLDVDCVEVQFTVPLLNFSKVILPDCGREYIFKDKALFLRSQVSQVSARNDGHPFAAFVDQTGRGVYAFGLVSFLRESTCRCTDPQISARNAMRGGHDLLTLSFRLPSEGWQYGKVRQVRETVWRKRGARTWFHAFRRYADICRKFHKVEYPASKPALEPTWCTWTAWCSDQLSDQSVLENARIARELGVRSVILDDGWFGPGLDTDDRVLNIGDYYPDPEKFADLRALARKLHEIEMDLLLWYAPTCISPDSRTFARLADHAMMSGSERVMAPNGFYNLCPCNPEVRAHVRGEIVRMLKDYDADGFKVDLYNTLPDTPCDAEHEHDCESVIEGMHRMMRGIWQALRRIRPDGTLELKQNYGNVIAAQYGTMVRAGDTAYDVDTNLQRCAYIQAYAPITHNDYLASSVHDDPRDIAVMMIKQITGGVPTLSMDLTKQPKANLAIIKSGLGFYRSHLRLWSTRRAPLDPRLNVWQMGNRKTAVISALFDAVELPLPDREEVTILNGTGRTHLTLRARDTYRAQVAWSDHTLQETKTRRLRISDQMALETPIGGKVTLRRL